MQFRILTTIHAHHRNKLQLGRKWLSHATCSVTSWSLPNSDNAMSILLSLFHGRGDNSGDIFKLLCASNNLLKKHKIRRISVVHLIQRTAKSKLFYCHYVALYTQFKISKKKIGCNIQKVFGGLYGLVSIIRYVFAIITTFWRTKSKVLINPCEPMKAVTNTKLFGNMFFSVTSNKLILRCCHLRMIIECKSHHPDHQ